MVPRIKRPIRSKFDLVGRFSFSLLNFCIKKGVLVINLTKKVLVTSTIVLANLSLAACDNKSSSKQSKNQTLNWSETTQLSTQDPSLATDTTSFQALLNTGDGLYRLDKNNNSKLSLAKSVKESKNSTVYDFDLRKNAKWSNGDPINFLDVFQKGSSYLNNGWNNPKFNQLLNESENIYGNEPVKHWNRLVEAEKILIKDQGTITLVKIARPQLLKTNVKNVSFNSTGMPYDFKNVYLTQK